MTSKKYIIIDKNIICDGISLSFDIFSPAASKLELYFPADGKERLLYVMIKTCRKYSKRWIKKAKT